jgi:hypothetical protein
MRAAGSQVTRADLLAASYGVTVGFISYSFYPVTNFLSHYSLRLHPEVWGDLMDPLFPITRCTMILHPPLQEVAWQAPDKPDRR